MLLLPALFVGALVDSFGLSLARHVLNGYSLHFGKIHIKLAGKSLSWPLRLCTTCPITTVTIIAWLFLGKTLLTRDQGHSMINLFNLGLKLSFESGRWTVTEITMGGQSLGRMKLRA